MQQLFSHGFNQGDQVRAVADIDSHVADIDKKIAHAAPEWPIDQIAKIDLAILRLAVYELTVEKKEPPKVIIDEAIELAKEFGNQNSPQFVNGVLGTIYKSIGK